MLTQASILLQLTGTRNLEAKAFLANATQLASVQQEQQRTEAGIRAARLRSESHFKDHIAKLLSDQKASSARLPPRRCRQVQQGTVNSGGGITHAHYNGPTADPGGEGRGVRLRPAQLPLQLRRDGAVQRRLRLLGPGDVRLGAAKAGISIPRDTYSQWAALPHVSLSDLQPGDLVYYNGIGHVAMYVGGGMIIDAPTEGQPVRELPMSTSWYASSFNGAARP